MRRLRLGRWLGGRSDEKIEDLEEEYWKLHIQKLNVTPGKKTVLAEADSELFDVDELRAQVGRWESGLRIETLFNKVIGKTEMYVLLNDMRPCLNPTDIPQSRERSRSPAEIKVRRLCPKKAGPLPVVPQFNCGFPRRKKVARSKRERSRKRKRKPANDVTDSSSLGQKRKRLSVPETEIDQQAFVRKLRLKRRKLLSQKSRSKMVKVDKGKEREHRAQQKAKEKEREAQQKELKKEQGEEKRVEQRRTERERKEWNSGWRKLNASETACVRKSIKECMRNHEKNRMMVSGVISDVLERVFEMRTKKIPFQAVDDDDAPEKVSFQADSDCDSVLSDVDDNDKENTDLSPLSLVGGGSGGGDPMIEEDLEQFDREEILEWLRVLGSDVDFTQNTIRLRSALLTAQITSHISLLHDSTVARVLKHFGKQDIRHKKRRKPALIQLYIGRPELQRNILDQITILEAASLSGSESESSGMSDGTYSSPCTPTSSGRTTGKPLSAKTPATPRSGTPTSSARIPSGTAPAATLEGQPPKLLWNMSRQELLSFLADAHASPCHSNKSTAEYRAKVGMIMVDNLLGKLNPDQVTEVLVRLNVNYVQHKTRRADNLRSHFKKKEATDELLKSKQHNVLFLLMETARAQNKEEVFKFPPVPNASGTAASTPTPHRKNSISGNDQQCGQRPNHRKTSFSGTHNQSSFSGTSSRQEQAQRNSSHASTSAGLKLQQPPVRSKKHHSTAPVNSHNVQEAAGQALQVQARSRVQVRFENKGNWCYINGLLNLLFSIPQFIEVLFHPETLQQISYTNQSNVAVLLELRRLSETSHQNVASANNLKLLLGPPWSDEEQQCSAELFTALYNRIECHNFGRLFCLFTTTEMRCQDSDCPPKINVGVNPEQVLKVSTRGDHVQQILEDYSAPEIVDLVEPLHPYCGIKIASKRYIISETGDAILVQLKRYEWNFETQVADRIDRAITVPFTIELNNKVWHLTGALRNHSGLGITSQGHYTGVTRDLTDGIFYKNDDQLELTAMRAQELNHFLNQCYLLAYSHQDSLPGGLAPPLQRLEGPGGDLVSLNRKRSAPDDQSQSKRRFVGAVGDHHKVGGAESLSVPTNWWQANCQRVSQQESQPRAKKTTKKGKQAGIETRKQFVNHFNPSAEEQAEIRNFIEARRLYLTERLERIKRNDFSIAGMPPNPLLNGILKMEQELNSIETPKCTYCDEVKFDVQLTAKTKRCPQCQKETENRRTPGLVRKFSKENGMHFDAVPDALKDLTPVEAAAIQRAFVVMKIYRLNSGATFLKGHCLAVMQDLEEFAKRLPPRPSDLPMIFLIGPGKRIPLTANANKILRALQWLIKNNPYYMDLEIDFDALSSYPQNDTDYVEGLTTIETKEDEQPDDPATVYTEKEGDGPDIVYSALPVSLPQSTVKEEIKRIILDQPDADTSKVEWPKKSSAPLNENTPGFLAMAFPHLFPYGKPDFVGDRPGEKPKLLEFLRHTLNSEDRRFAHDPKYLLQFNNRFQRGQAMTQANVYALYSCKDITVEQLKEQVAEDNYSTFKSLMFFTRASVGSRQFFKYEGKKSWSLVNWVHIMSDMKETFNLFVTLSFADLHEPALHRLLPGHELYLNKTVVNSLDQIPAGSDPSQYILASRDYRLRTEAVAKNGDIVCQYVNKKFWSFFEHVLKPLGVLDYIIRVEFQYRSSEHFHMVLRLLDGASVEAVQAAFSASKLETLTEEKFDALPEESKTSILEAHARAVASRHDIANFSTFRLGQTAIHPEPNPVQWPAPEGLNREKPRVNCLRRQFSDVVATQEGVDDSQTTENIPFQETTSSVDNSQTENIPFQAGNILDDPATAERILNDWILLANRVQLHKCCQYCLKIVTGMIAMCKFHYPQALQGFEADMVEALYEHVHNRMEEHPGAEFNCDTLFLARNHPRIVVTITEFLLGWRGNTSAEIVKSIPQLLHYVLKYMLKPTTGSKSFENTCKELTLEAENSSKASSIFQRVLMRQITEHDMSRTEAFRIALGLPFVFYSRKFKMVNLLGVRQVIIDHDNDEMEGANRRATKDNKADLYWMRENSNHYKQLVEAYQAGNIDLPWHPCDINLYMYVAHFESNWELAKETYVPHISPQFPYPPDPKDPKKTEMRRDYIRTQLLTFQPGMRPQRLPPPEQMETAMSDFVQTAHCPQLIREAYLKSLKGGNEEEENFEPLLEDPEPLDPGSIIQDPYMAGLGAALTKADLNNTNVIDEAEEEGHADIEQDVQYLNLVTDENEDWSRDRTHLGMTSHQMEDAVHWLDRMKAVTDVPQTAWEQSYEPDTLNPKQRQVYDRFMQYVMGDEASSTGQLIDLSGGAGTGKSRLIHTIMFQSEMQSGDRNRVKVCAFTNSAARAFVGGQTVHRLLRVDIERGPKGTWHRKQAELVGPRLADMQTDFTSVRAIIIDEKSMIGCFMLWCIDQRLRQARPSHSHLMFGGLVVMLCGDLSQLPPVTDKPLCYEGTGIMTDLQIRGRELYRNFNECYFLTESMRQQGASNELFRQELTRLANGAFSITDWQRWQQRSLASLPEEERQRFVTEGIKLCSRKVDMVPFNEAGLLRCNNPILVMEAVHNCSKAAKGTDTDAEGLSKVVPIARGSKVVLIDNLWPEMGLFNGSQGQVTYILFAENKGPVDGLPAFIVVTFPEYTGPPFIPGQQGTVPIFTRMAEWTTVDKVRCSRRMFGLLPANALTIHKAEGMTLETPVVIDIGPKEFAPGLTYTAVTRVRSLEGLAFDPMPYFNRIVMIFNGKAFKAKEKELRKRLDIARQLQQAADAPTVVSPAGAASPSDAELIEDNSQDVDGGLNEDNSQDEQALDEDLVCEYPLNEPRCKQLVHMRDYRRLSPTRMLNDVLITFGLDFLERDFLTLEQRTRLHVFRSASFANLTHGFTRNQYSTTPTNSLAKAMHARVRRLTKPQHGPPIDIFSKDLVLWPINHDTHWFVVAGINLGKDNPALFTLNSIGTHGEGAILEHIKAYLAVEYRTLAERQGSQLPDIRFLSSSPPQQNGNIDCGVYVLGFVEAIFRIFDQFCMISYSEVIGHNWIPSFSRLALRRRLAEKIRNLSDEQQFRVSLWPELNL